MKIERLELKNFSAINNAMGSNHITIDFTKSKNVICLLIGPNGSGKTTILSLLNPFADLGNLDVRNNNPLVLKDKDGYKEIHIRHQDILYVIKHYYTAHKDKNHSVKSYISRDGEELNENGNVSSFKEFVKGELGIEPSYLKLLRLGSNVTSLIDLTATERKNYMSKIMDDIEIYLSYYKEVNTKANYLYSMISHTTDKIAKLGVIDKVEIKKEITALKEKIRQEEEDYIKENQTIAVCVSSISSINDYVNLKEWLRIYTRRYKKMEKTLEKIDANTNREISYYEKEITRLEKEILSYENEIKSNELLINNILDHIDKEQEQVRGYKVELQKGLETDAEIKRMENNLKEMRKILNKYEDNLIDYVPVFTKEEFESFMVFLKNTQQLLNRTYEFGKPPISKVVELMKEKKNVVNYINAHLLDLDDEVEQQGSLFMSKIAPLLISEKKRIVISCKETCVAKDLFEQLQNLIMNAQVNDKKEDAQFYHDMNYVYQNLSTILPRFHDYKDTIEKLPEDVRKDFVLEKMYENISKLKFIYNDKKMNELLSIISEYENYLEMKKKYKDSEDTLQKFSGILVTSSLKDHIKSLEDSIEEGRDNIRSLKERTIELKELISEATKTMESLLDIKEVIEEYDSVKEKYEELVKDNEKFDELSYKREMARTRSKELEIRLATDRDTLKTLEEKLSLYKSLNKELSSYNQLYDEMIYTKNALSAKKGMPLHIISDYLHDVESVTNELLDIAYDGKIFIDNFDISPNEFNIPFYNNGVRLPDVKYASQGELSFLSIALAFALSRQSLRKYNIMLLDEMDGELDTKNREKFLRIIETQIGKIMGDQCFLITHNNMFSSYPVDVIDLSGRNDKGEYPRANFIKIDKR